MAESTKIEWADATFNPWMGCTKVSPACKNCYAERDMDHRYGRVAWGPNGTRVRTSDANWRKPLMWNRKAAAEGRRLRVFCASLADVFEDWQGDIRDSHGGNLWITPDGKYESQAMTNGRSDFVFRESGCRRATMDDLRRDLFALIDQTPNLDWLLLTKRPENVLDMTLRAQHGTPGGWWFKSLLTCPANVWIGTSVESQEWAEKRVPELLKIPAAVRFLSCEPLVGPVEVSRWLESSDGFCIADDLSPIHRKDGGTGIHWVITGGESGPDARPMHPNWFRSLRDQCESVGTPFHFKQWGEWRPQLARIAGAPAPVCAGVTWCVMDDDGEFFEYATPWNGRQDDASEYGEVVMVRVGKKSAGRLLDGRTWDELPQVVATAE